MDTALRIRTPGLAPERSKLRRPGTGAEAPRPTWAPALLTLALLIALALLAAPVTAQTPTLNITEASLRLWPEYDDPGLLVIFSGTLTETGAFPQQVAFPIPANARNIQATYEDATGGLITQAWQIVDGKLTYNLPAPRFHIEYYVDRAPSGNERAITHVFEAPYAVQTLRVTAQQPARATGFSLMPQPEQTLQGEDGLIYHLFNRVNLAAGEKVEIQLRYTKTDSGLSKPQLAIPSTTPSAPATASSGAGAADWLPWALMGVGAAVLFGAVGYWLLTQRRTQAAAPARPAGRSAPRVQAPPAKPAAAAFCTQCGAALRPDDRFCSQCGAPRRG